MEKRLVHTIEVTVRWCDMDAFGHVNNSIYFSYFEMARIAWWDTIHENISFEKEGPVIIDAHCVFLKALFYPEIVTVKLYAGPPGRSSYQHYYEIFSKSQPDLKYAEGSTKVVWVDRQAAHSIPLPEIFLPYLPERSP